MDQTRAQVARLGLGHVELRTLADVDEPVDLVHVPSGWLGSLLPAQAATDDDTTHPHPRRRPH
jgi:hypothetical protein